VIAVSPDTVEQNAGVVADLGLSFPVLSDGDLKLTDALSLRHAGASVEGTDVPRPATYFVEGGRVVWVELTENYRIRPRPDQLLARIPAP
jgi:peroxiredoxin